MKVMRSQGGREGSVSMWTRHAPASLAALQPLPPLPQAALAELELTRAASLALALRLAGPLIHGIPTGRPWEARAATLPSRLALASSPHCLDCRFRRLGWAAGQAALGQQGQARAALQAGMRGESSS